MQANSNHNPKHGNLLNKRMRKVVVAIVFVFVSVFVSANASQSDGRESVVREGQETYDLISTVNWSNLPSISAVLKKYNERNPDVVVTNWIQLSPAGMRIIDADSKAEIIKNFVQERVWLTNKKNKTSHEVDIAFFQEHFPDQVPYLIGPESFSNISGLIPCAELVGYNSGKRVWRGQVVEVWDCQFEDGKSANTQLFSNRWDIVVQVKHTDKRIEELIDIKEEKLPESLFVPNSVLKNVEITEFMTGRALLDSYSP